MAQNEIKTTEMVRRIRDRHHEQLKGMTPEERTAFYAAKAKKAMERARILLQEHSGDGAR